LWQTQIEGEVSCIFSVKKKRKNKESRQQPKESKGSVKDQDWQASRLLMP